VADDIVVERRMEEVIAVEVEAAPVERGLRRPPKELTRRVAEELGDVDPLGLPSRAPARGRGRRPE
jgi:hypothetical protein